MTTLRRIAPALALLIISPLIAEFLLGDFNIRQIGFIAVFIPVYGCGALLVREITRRTGRGWPTMLLLALAYALILEGWINMTLFNPTYAGQRLLDYGFVPALGTSPRWSVYVLTLHTVWSVGAAVGLAEGLAGARWSQPWLRRPGLIVAVVGLLFGLAATLSFTLRTFHFVATVPELLAVGVLVTMVTLIAFRRFRSAGGHAATPTTPRFFWLVLVISLVLSSTFQWWFIYTPAHGWSAAAALAGLLGIEGLAIGLFVRWTGRWGPAATVAAATGACLTYGWISISRLVVSGGTSLGVPTTPIDVVGQAGLLAATVGLSYVAWRRLPKAARYAG